MVIEQNPPGGLAKGAAGQRWHREPVLLPHITESGSTLKKEGGGTPKANQSHLQDNESKPTG